MNKRISDLTAIPSPLESTDLIEVSQDIGGGSYTSCKATLDDVSNYIAGAIYTGNWDDPNGNVTPTAPTKGALYYKDDTYISLWAWSVSNTNWFPMIT